MYKKDYFMTLIEELSQFLARLMFLKQTGRLDIASQEIGEFCTRVFGRDAGELMRMPYDELIPFASSAGTLDVQRAVALASILKEMGDVAALRNGTAASEEDACGAYGRALALLLEAYGTGEEALPLGVVEKLEIVLDKVAGCELPANLRWGLFRYYESVGFYADAEDLLFEMIDAGETEGVAEGLAFYDRLLLHSDQDLANGNLPRTEVEEGRAALAARRS